MVRSKKYSAFIKALGDSLINGQYEFNGYPFDKDELWAFGSEWYNTTEEFKAELDEMILNGNQARLTIYVKEIYEEITRWGVLFRMLVESYERKYVCNDGKAAEDVTKYNFLHSLEAYQRTHAYMLVVEETVNKIRKDAVKYLALDLPPIQQLTIDSYTIDGKFIIEPPTSMLDVASEIEPLSHAQICLIRIYEEKPISKINAQSVAEEYKHSRPNAGRVLLKKYDKLDDEASRLKRRDIEYDIESVKPLLSNNALKKAESELVKIKNKRR